MRTVHFKDKSIKGALCFNLPEFSLQKENCVNYKTNRNTCNRHLWNVLTDASFKAG